MKNSLPAIAAVLFGAFGFANAQTVTLRIENKNASVSNPHITFIQAVTATSTWDTNGESSTSLNGPALDANAGGTALVNGTSYAISEIGSTITLSPDWQGHIYLSDGPLTSVLNQLGQSPSQSANPSPPPAFLIPPFSQAPFFPTDPDPTSTTAIRYNYIELAGGSSAFINPDITYINYFSLPIQMTRASDGVTRGKPLSQANLNTLASRLAALSGDSASIVSKTGGTVNRVVSPDNGPTIVGFYPTFVDYIDAAFGAGAKTINLQNFYSNSGSGLSQDQTYSPRTSAPVTYDGSTLTIRGTSDLASTGDFTITATYTPEELSAAIYANVLTYDVVYGPSSTVINGAGTGDNNVFSAVSRDLLAGFSYGFINSPTQGDKTSAEWQALPLSDAFSAAQSSSIFYNTYAAAFASTFNDVYNFPFNDFLSGFSPELTVNTGDTLVLTLLADADTVAKLSIQTPNAERTKGKRAKFKVSLSTDGSLRAKASGGAKAIVRGRNPYRVIVKKLTKRVTKVKLIARDASGQSARKTVRVIRK